MQIGQKIKKLRELKNLTQDYMAQELGITQSAYSRMELGETELTYNKLEKIANLFEVKPEDIINFSESMIFNVMHNEVANGFVINNNHLSEGEKNLYLQQIDLLKEEVNHLKAIINKLMK
jgi:transcriptional regulator with XRE-family HTH domain